MLTLLRLLLLAGCATACGERGSAREREARIQVDSTLVVATRDSAVRAALEALRERRPWRATQLVAPALADSARRTPDALIVGATAAARWNGWGEVRRLLGGAPWLDSLFQGRGRVLLARAALALRDDSAAVANARAALAAADDDAARAERTVLLARAYDRLMQGDSARAAYARAARLLPQAADWLLLRAAGVTADSAERARDYAAVRSDVASARVGWTEAQARERFGDRLGAARLYDSLGASAAALRNRLAVAPDSAARLAVRQALVALLRREPGTDDARAATQLLDASFAPLTPDEELLAARSAVASGPLARAAQGFARGLGAPGATVDDRFAYATVLARLGRDAEAAAQYARIAAPRALAARAAYQRARALLGAGNGSAARAALRDILRRYARDTTSASSALYLLADLATDDGRDAAARDAFLTLAHRYPTSDRAAAARFRAAIVAYVAGQTRHAAAELDTIFDRYSRSDEALAAGYWSGRAWARLGDTAKARARWRAVAEREPLSYYAMASSKRLGIAPWAPPPAPDSAAPLPAIPAIDSAAARAALLDQLGMDVESRFEADRIAKLAADSTPALLAGARALRDLGQPSRGIQLGWRALDRGAPRDARVYRIVYPLVERDALLADARARELDPALVAGLIRQESSYNPGATSPAGARGLMQLMPSVGAQLARAARFPVWDPVLLYQPDVNLQLGTTHLAALIRQYLDPAYVLAAYNAGTSRVDRWRQKAGADDPELFIERIPYVETRDYVRIVLRNAAMYRALYGL